MTSRQAGRFFFEPKDYVEVNDCTHEYKEEVKVGYNFARKVALKGLAINHVQEAFDVSERRACRVLGPRRSTQAVRPKPFDPSRSTQAWVAC